MNNLAKRILLGMLLGLIFGVICFAWFTKSPDLPPEMLSMQVWSWDNIMMWTIIANRFVLGFVVAIAWFITIHPFFRFKVPVVLRWAKFGALVSLLMAIWALMWNMEGAWITFWMIILFGAVIGAVIDLILTKVAGQGKDLIIKKK